MAIKRMSLVLCLFFFISVCSIVMSGCRTGNRGSDIVDENIPATSTPAIPRQIVVNLEREQMISIEKQQYAYSVKEFDVGKGTYISPAGKEMPYNIKGIIGIPEGDGPFPLVLITHGSHSNDNENLRFDTGYSYLVEELAKQGLVAVSMDMSKAYTWKYGDNDDREKSQYLATEHLNSLMQANKGEQGGYPTDFNLVGKIDFNRIALVGHSRGGETIFDIAEDMKNKGTPVEALLCIAPTYLFDDRDWPEAKVALLVPEYDGDVISLDGIALYDVLGEKTKGEHLAVFLKGANHNYFNSNIERDDARMLASRRDISDQLTRKQQETFLRTFASDYLYKTLQKDAPFLSLDKAQPDTMYGERVSILYRNARSEMLFSAGAGTEYATENLTAEIKTDAWYFKKDELLVDTITYGEEELQSRQLLKLDWADAPGVLKFGSFEPSLIDLRGYASLTLDLVVNAADEKNMQLEYQRFAVRLTDASSNTATVNLPDNLQALKRGQGELDFTPLYEENIYFWSLPTPLTSIILPLSSFEGVNLAEVKSVELLFEDTSSGSLLIEAVRIQ